MILFSFNPPVQHRSNPKTARRRKIHDQDSLDLALAGLVGASLLGTIAAGTRAGSQETDGDTLGPTVLITDQVANKAQLTDRNGIVHAPVVLDPNLVNPWGITESAIEYRGRALRFREIPAPAKPQVLDTPAENVRPRVPISVKKRKWSPPANHPWHQAVRREVQKRASKLAAAASRPSLAWPSVSP